MEIKEIKIGNTYSGSWTDTLPKELIRFIDLKCYSDSGLNEDKFERGTIIEEVFNAYLTKDHKHLVLRSSLFDAFENNHLNFISKEELKILIDELQNLYKDME